MTMFLARYYQMIISSLSDDNIIIERLKYNIIRIWQNHDFLGLVVKQWHLTRVIRVRITRQKNHFINMMNPNRDKFAGNSWFITKTKYFSYLKYFERYQWLNMTNLRQRLKHNIIRACMINRHKHDFLGLVVKQWYSTRVIRVQITSLKNLCY